VRKVLKSIVPEGVRHELRLRRDLWRTLRRLSALRRPVTTRSHQLPGALIVNVTSYPPRYKNLHLTIKSLLNQTVSADEVILWIADKDVSQLPRTVKNLTANHKFSIRTAPDYRSYKKLIPALLSYPEAYLAIADDDAFYPPDWLEQLTGAWYKYREERRHIIPCHRAHRFPEAEGRGFVPPYSEWEWDIGHEGEEKTGEDIIPTGVGGVLYPPGSLHPEVTDSEKFMALAPTGDDLWFYWMARRVGSSYVKTSVQFRIVTWPGTQDTALLRGNAGPQGDANDVQIAKLLSQYGYPGRDQHWRQGV
jgi:hypothetical protein